MAETNNPMQTSGDYDAMSGYWTMVDAIVAGAEAMRAIGGVRPAGSGRAFAQSPYLPAFPNESQADYELRRCHAPFTNIYEDISGNLAAKPFAKTCELAQDAGDDLKKLAENIDGQGHSLHVFAQSVFKPALDKGIDWILIDHTSVPQGATLADERSMGARPYWVRIPAERMLAVYSAFLNGSEAIYHARVYEPATVREGFSETTVERVRVMDRAPIYDVLGNLVGFGPATWKLLEQSEKTEGGKKETVWIEVSAGNFTIGVIPLVPVVPVGRLGMSWRVKPAFRDIAYMQIEEFQQESSLKSIKELTAFPMLAGNGVMPPTDAKGQPVTVPVGPRGVLFAPPGGDGKFGNWAFVEPAGSSLTFLQTDLEKHREQMRSLGRQPMASANLTVITTANVSMKASSAVQAWAIMLKDALEQAWVLTCKWLGQEAKAPAVNLHMDFGVDLEGGTELDALQKAQASGVISKRLQFNEMKRRGTLSDNADWDDDQEQMAEEQQGLEPEQPIDPLNGDPLAPVNDNSQQAAQ